MAARNISLELLRIVLMLNVCIVHVVYLGIGERGFSSKILHVIADSAVDGFGLTSVGVGWLLRCILTVALPMFAVYVLHQTELGKDIIAYFASMRHDVSILESAVGAILIGLSALSLLVDVPRRVVVLLLRRPIDWVCRGMDRWTLRGREYP